MVHTQLVLTCTLLGKSHHEYKNNRLQTHLHEQNKFVQAYTCSGGIPEGVSGKCRVSDYLIGKLSLCLCDSSITSDKAISMAAVPHPCLQCSSEEDRIAYMYFEIPIIITI